MQTATRGSADSGLAITSAIGAEWPFQDASTGPSSRGSSSTVPSWPRASLPSSSVATSSIHSVRGSSTGAAVTIPHQ